MFVTRIMQNVLNGYAQNSAEKRKRVTEEPVRFYGNPDHVTLSGLWLRCR